MMTSRMLARSLPLFREHLARNLGCEVADFDSQALTIVQRPADSKKKQLVTVLTLGTGTVVSVEEPFLEVARSIKVEKHFHAFGVQQLHVPILEEAARRGVDVVSRNTNLGFLLDEEPAMPALPEGLRLERWQREQCEPWAPTFHNALWEEGDDELDKFLYALVLLDPAGQPRAMAGAWYEDDGLIEIGVDVAREARGLALAPIIVRSLARTILDSGNVPTYYCAATNVRSHRTALASGFVPVVTSSGIRAKPSSATPPPPGPT